jgi:N-acetylmuramoyl-L-alanine amidase
MPTHTVTQGECLTLIALRHGFSNPKDIYDHPDNAELRKSRPNMNVLHPGDVVAVPEKEKKVVSCATHKRHRFEVKLPKKKLVLVIVGNDGTPIEGVPYELAVADEVHTGTTDGSGKIEHDVPVTATAGTLRLAKGAPAPVRIGSLNPMQSTDDDGVTGVQSRLHNLGYSPGPVDGRLGSRTRAAIRLFQGDNGLDPTGEIDGALMGKLEAAHGC